jgi:hypothetical protein
MTKIIGMFVVLFFGSAALLFAASPDMKTGKWQVTMKMEMEGAPFPMPPVVYTQCITKDDLKDAKKTTPNSEIGRAHV